MDLGLGGKVVVVTGGAKGIGAAIVRAAAAEGMITVIVDRDAAAGAELAAALRSTGHTRRGRHGCARRGRGVRRGGGDGDGALRAVRRAGQQRRGERWRGTGKWIARGVCCLAGAQSLALLRHGPPCVAGTHRVAGGHRQHRLESRADGAGRHVATRPRRGRSSRSRGNGRSSCCRPGSASTRWSPPR